MPRAPMLDAGRRLDLILLDLRMPGVQGLSGLIYLRAQYPNVPVVIMTASDDHGLVQKALNLNASGYHSQDLRHRDHHRCRQCRAARRHLGAGGL